MNIVLFIHSLAGGGAERVSSHLVNAWVEMGYTVSLITLTDIKSDAYTLNPNIQRIGLGLDIESKSALDAIIANLRRILALRQELKKRHADVVIGMMTTAAVLCVLASTGLTCKTVISERIYPPSLPIGKIWNLMRKIIYRFADVIVAQTQICADWLELNTGCSKKNIVVIPNPIAWPLPSTEPTIDIGHLLSKKEKLIIAVGRLEKQKGFDLLITAVKNELLKSDWKLIIFGEGSERGKLQKLINDLSLTHSVFLPGRAGNIAGWYERADIYVMSSRFEGFPNTLAEAMAAGCPAISFDCETGPRDIIRHGIDGLLVEPGNIQQLAQAMALLMEDESLRQKFAKSAIECRERFSLNHVLSLWNKAML